MTINTQFEPGSKVFTLRDRTIIHETIHIMKIAVIYKPEVISVVYTLFGCRETEFFKEDDLFSTKQELLDSL